MTAAQLLSLLTKISIVLIVFSTGMAGKRGSLGMLLRQPSLLLRSLLSMLVVAPLVAVGFATSLQVPQAVKIALVMMAVSPVPPFLPQKAIKAGGSQSYVISLLALSALISIITAPGISSASSCAHCTGLNRSSGGASTSTRALIDCSAALVSPLKSPVPPTSCV